MSSLFQAIKSKKETQFQKTGKTKVKALPPNFFEQVLVCEIQMKKGFSMVTLQKLINYYSQAIEYYESINDPRFARYSKSLQLLLMQPEVMKHINLQTSKGKIKVQKQERKKAVMNELHKVDKIYEKKENEDAKNLITQSKEQDKKEDLTKVINQELDEQKNNFKKKLEEKKKKKMLNISEEGSTDKKDNDLKSNKDRKTSTNKQLNKSFDAIGKDESIFSNDVSIEPISMFNIGETNLSLTDGINNNLDFFFNDFDNIFNEKVTKAFIDRLSQLTKDKIDDKLKTALDYADKIKDCEFKLTFDENLSVEEKDNIGNKILALTEEQKKAEKDIEEKYKEKINQLKEEFQNQNIQNFDWVKNLKDKYSSDIDSSIYNFIGN
jgi:hypothetical protein